MNAPDVNLVFRTAIIRKAEDIHIVEEERQDASPEPVLVFRVFFAGNGAFVVSPLLLANPGVNRPERFNVGNKTSATGVLNVDAGKLRTERPVLPRIPDGIKTLDVVEKPGGGHVHRQSLAHGKVQKGGTGNPGFRVIRPYPAPSSD